MGFFTGRVTCVRFRVDGPTPALFGPEHLEKLASRRDRGQLSGSGDNR